MVKIAKIAGWLPVSLQRGFGPLLFRSGVVKIGLRAFDVFSSSRSMREQILFSFIGLLCLGESGDSFLIIGKCLPVVRGMNQSQVVTGRNLLADVGHDLCDPTTDR